MATAFEQTPRGGLGHFFRQAVVLGGGAFVALALFPLTVTVASAAAIPLAGLLASSRPREPREFAFLAGSAALALWWLASVGELPGQMLRAAALFAGVTFVVLTLVTRLSTVHRALAALTAAAIAVSTLLLVLRSSWQELSWWVQFRIGVAIRTVIGAVWAGEEAGIAIKMSNPEQIQGWLESMVTMAGEFYGAIVVLTVGVALYTAAAIFQRVGKQHVGQPLGRLADFRFSEHIGWVAVLSLAVVLIPKLVALKMAAANILVVSAALYALRGVAVFVFFLEVVSGGGFLLSLLIAVIIFVMLPVVIGGAVVLGVLDTGLDFRRRWMVKPPTGE